MNRIPPQNLDAEREILGAMMLDDNALAVALEMLEEDDLYAPRHRMLFRACRDLHGRREPVDSLNVMKWLEARGEQGTLRPNDDSLLLIVGKAYVTETVSAGLPHACKQRAGIVKECSLRRRYLADADAIIAAACDQSRDFADVKATAEERIYATGAARGERATVQPIGEYAFRAYEHLYAAAQEQQAPGLRTGWKGVNSYLRPFRAGQLVILSADTGSGKTAWVLNMSIDFAEQGHHGMLFSLEMEGEDLSTRALLEKMTYTQDDLDNIQQHHQAQDVLTATEHAMRRLYDLPLIVDEEPGNTILRIEEAIRREKQARGPLAFVAIDYLQLIPGGESGRKRYEEVGRISRELKELAKRHKIVVFALCQLGTKALAERPTRRPQLSDLYESGRIGQDADMVLSLYRPGHYGKAEVKKAGYNPDDQWHYGLTELAALKARAGTVAGRHQPLLQWFNGPHYSFRDLTSDEWKTVRSQGIEG